MESRNRRAFIVQSCKFFLAAFGLFAGMLGMAQVAVHYVKSHAKSSTPKLPSHEGKSRPPDNQSSSASSTYVIAGPCVGVKDTACVDVCPVDVIHPRKDENGFKESDQLFIDPWDCISCGACVPVCPVFAIYPTGKLPKNWAVFIQKNKLYFSREHHED
jgi:NAD-dependent dihydropyrimidine dehydrogenase PreA subunit